MLHAKLAAASPCTSHARHSNARFFVWFQLVFCLGGHSCKSRRHNEREYYRCFSVHLDTVSIQLDLPPADSLVRPRACVAPIKLLGRVDVDGALGAIAHQVRISNVVLHQSPTQDNHACPLCSDRNRVDLANVLYNVDTQLLWRRLERVKIQHVAQTSICESWAEDRDVVLPCPVVDRSLIVDLLAQAVDDLARGPVQRLVSLLASLLLLEHLVENGHDPVLEGAVVAVGDHEVADAVHALFAQVGARRGEGAQVGGGETLDKVFLNAAGRGDNGRDMFMLDQVAQCFAQARRDEIGRISEKDGGAVARLRVSPGALSGISIDP